MWRYSTSTKRGGSFHEAVEGRSIPRVVYLTEEAVRVPALHAESWRSGKLLRNTNGMAWTPYSIKCVFIATRIG